MERGKRRREKLASSQVDDDDDDESRLLACVVQQLEAHCMPAAATRKVEVEATVHHIRT